MALDKGGKAQGYCGSYGTLLCKLLAYPTAPEVTASHMKRLPFTSVPFIVVCTFALTALPQAKSQPGIVKNATVLLDEAVQKQQDRKRAAKQRELDRISEEMKKGKQEAAELQQSISQVGSASNESKSNLDLLAGRKKNTAQDLELLGLRIDAEKLKAEGLILLSTAQAKALDALTKRQEELDLRTAVYSAEIQKMSLPDNAGESEPKKGKSESGPSVTELRRNLAKAEDRTELADAKAREAMAAAARKLEQAEAVAAKVEKKQAEYGQDKHPNAPLKP